MNLTGQNRKTKIKESSLKSVRLLTVHALEVKMLGIILPVFDRGFASVF